MDMEKSFVKGMAEYGGRLKENRGECARRLALLAGVTLHMECKTYNRSGENEGAVFL